MRKFAWILLLLVNDVFAQPVTSAQVRQRLIRNIEETAHNFDGVMGLAIIDLQSGEEILINAQSTFPTGSSIKIPILIELHRQAAAGTLKLTETLPITNRQQVGGSGVLLHFAEGGSQLSLHDLSILMIALSDNTATNLLIERLGMDRINQTIVDLGLPGIKLQRKMIDLAAMARGAENIATPREAARLLELLAQGKVINTEVSAAVLKTLRIPKSSPIPRLLPASTTVANKPGGLEGVACDWGLIEIPNRPFAIAVMTTYNGESAGADEAIARISRLAYDYFSRLARSTPYGARVPMALIKTTR
ncbi:MAG: serine hydrolase [Acidobacteriota bacterium]|jgi:beta-lactamase class A